MKASRYNFFVRQGDRILGVNLLSRSILDLSVEAYQAYLAYVGGLLSAGEDGESDAFIGTLRENLFALEDDWDELEFIRRRTQEERFGSDQLGLVIAPTMGCNFSCHYCFEEKDDSHLNADAQDRLADLVEERIVGCRDLSVQWFGGEPLLSMDTIEALSGKFLRIAERAGAGYAATVISNGYYLSADVSTRLIASGARHVQITLDGDRELHDRTRREPGGDSSFDRILANIRSAPSEMTVSLRIHVAPFNSESVKSLINRLAREGLPELGVQLYFAPLFNYRAGMKEAAYSTDEKRFMTTADFAPLQVQLYSQARGLGFSTKDYLAASYGICTAVRSNTIVVDAAGRLVKCYKDVGVEEEAVGDLISGEGGGPQLTKWMDLDVPRDEECRECRVLPLCLGGCSKQWHAGAPKSVICSPLKHNLEDLLRLEFDGEAARAGSRASHSSSETGQFP